MNKLDTRQTILVVDDSPVNLQMLGQLLQDEWQVKVATKGKTALEIINSQNPPDLILLDVMMPDLDGYRLCEIMKASPEMRHIPVIFVTAMGQEEDEAKGLSLGAIDYIVKPYNAAIVKARVRNHLELKRYRDMLKNATMIDGLTGIANRRSFDDTLQKEWKRALRHQQPISLLMMDIDYFKNYNDHYGHLAGDDCLRAVAQTLAENIKRPADLAARYGGEEFVGLMPEIGADGADLMARRLHQAIRDLSLPHAASEVDEIVTVSVGVATVVPTSEEGWNQLVKQADEAMYRAKTQGRDQVVQATATLNKDETGAANPGMEREGRHESGGFEQ